MRRMNMSKTLLKVMLPFLIAGLLFAAPAAAQDKGTINIGWTAWSSTEATTNLVKKFSRIKWATR